MRKLYLYFLKHGHRFGLLMLIAAFLIGGAFRFYNLTWSDKGSHHPDENQVMMQVGKLNYKNMNPGFFAYGSLPLYLYKFAADGAQYLNRTQPIVRDFLPTQPYLLARGLTAFLSTLTILAVFGIGSRLYGRYVGFLASFLFAFCVLPIKLAHFLTVDAILNFFLMMSLYYGARIVDKGRLRDYIPAGIFYGFSMATKASAITSFFPLFIAHFIRLHRAQRPFSIKLWLSLILMIVFAAGSFYAGMPYAIHDWDNFYPQVKYQADMVAGKTTPWYVLHYENTTPVLYQLYNLVFWGVGAPLGVAGLAGFAFFIYAFLRRRKGEHLYLLATAVPYFIMVYVMAKVKFIRYQVPMVPLFCIMASYLLYWLYCNAATRKLKNLVLAATFFVVSATVLYSVALMSIYYKANTWEAASHWIYQNIPDNSKILKQEIEASLPVGLPGYGHKNYKYSEINIIEEPSGIRGVRALAEKIADVDYIILPNPGHYNLPLSAGSKRFPVITSYFQNLFGGTLGFDLVATFTSPPAIGKWEFDDSQADIGFWFFDHPKVQIFKKTKPLASEEIVQLLQNPDENIASITKRQIRGAASGHKASPDYFASQVGRETAKSEPEKGFHYIFIWYLALQFFALLGLPLAVYVFKDLPDRGYAMAKVIGLFLTAWVDWLLVNLKIMAYDRAGVLFSIALVFMLAMYFYRRHPALLRGSWHIHGFKSQILLTEAVFLVLYLIFMGIRVWNPDIHNWERPSEFAYYNALNRSETLPPYDPWISGHPLNYYYYCWHVMIMLTKLLHIPTHFSYGIGVPMVAALVGMCVFSLVYNMTRRRFYGLLGVLIFNFVGNYDALRQVFDTRRFGINWFQSAHSPIEYTINEFPFWSYLYGDLHPHIFVLPVIMLLMTFLYSILRSFERGFARFGQGIDGLLYFFLIALAAGTISTIHLWDMPAQAVITFCIFVFQFYRMNRLERQRLGSSYQRPGLEARAIGWFKEVLLPVALIWLVGDFLFLPYPLGLDTATSRSGLLVMLLKPILPEPEFASATFSIGVAPTLAVKGNVLRSYTSPLWQSLMIFGLFLLVTIPIMLLRNWEYSKIKNRTLIKPFTLFAQIFTILVFDLWNRKELDYVINKTSFHFQTFVRILFVLAAVAFVVSVVTTLYRHFKRGGAANILGFGWAVFEVALLGVFFYYINIRPEQLFPAIGNLFKPLMTMKVVAALPFLKPLLANLTKLSGITTFNINYALALLLVPFVIGLLRSLFESEFEAGDQFSYLMLFMGMGIVFGDELVYLADFLSGGDWCRMNSVFKFHFQAVVLLSIGITIGLCYMRTRITRLTGIVTSGRRLMHLIGFIFGAVLMAFLFSSIKVVWVYGTLAGVVVVLLVRWALTLRNSGGSRFRRLMLTVGLDAFDVTVITMIVLSFIYALGGTYMKIKDKSNSRANVPTLNGIAFKKTVNPEEYEAIQWLNENIKGSPVILETTGPSYQDYSRVSMNTGLPTILGWGSHVVARGFTWQEIINDRGKGLDLIYDTKDVQEALTIIKRYNVAYIYVGYLEHKRNDKDGLAKFDRYKNIFTLIFENAKVKIYEVRGHQFWHTGAQAAQDKKTEFEGEMELALSGNMLVGGKGPDKSQFANPRGVAIDQKGNFYVADTGNNRVQKFDAGGAFQQSWSREPGRSKEPFLPYALAVDATDKVYVTDVARNAVWYLLPDDESPRILIDQDIGLTEPRGIAVSKDTIYLADTGNRQIITASLDGKVKGAIRKAADGTALFIRPTGVAVDAENNLYVADATARKIYVLRSNGAVTREILINDQSGGILEDMAIAIDEDNNILVTAPGQGGFMVFNPEGLDITKAVTGGTATGFGAPAGIAAFGRTIYVTDALTHRVQNIVKEEPPSIFTGGNGSKNGEFDVPRDIAIDSNGNIFVVDFHNYRIQKFNRKGEFVLSWGEQGEALEQFKDPCGIAIGPDNAVYVADTWNNRVQVFDNNGRLITSWSGGAGGFFAPRSITADAEGYIYVCDTGNARVHIFTKDGQFQRAVSSKGKGPEQLFEPCGIAVDADRNIYVADSGNARIQVFTNRGEWLRSIPIPEFEGPVQEPYLEIDSDGALYATIPNSDKVVKYSLDGQKQGEVVKGPAFGFNAPTGIALTVEGDLLIMNMNDPKAIRVHKRQFR